MVFMQENRSFDHYFGTLRGVCGFNDLATTTPLGGGVVVSESRSEPPD